VRLQLANPSEHPAVAGLPFDRPLAHWELPGIRGVLGLHRHEVRRVSLGPVAYVIKELPDELARREYRLLRELADDGLPTVEVVAVVTDRELEIDGHLEPVDGLLITRHLEYSLPYRSLLSVRSRPIGATPDEQSEQLLDALVGLLVRLHLTGFYWGDCSLNNTLFRRDAGALSAYVIDVETGERYPQLSDGQRTLDLQIAMENVAGGLLDLQLGGRLSPEIDPWEVASAIEARYDDLWIELTRTDEVAPTEFFHLEQRLERLHELGFDVEEMEVVSSRIEGTDTPVLRIVPRVVEHGYHANRLHDLTGLDTQENQARRLLNDLRSLGAEIQDRTGIALDERAVASTWLDERFDTVIAAIPANLRTKFEPAEMYHQYLEHRWQLSEAAGRDVDSEQALDSFIATVLEPARDEQILEPTAEVPIIEPATIEPAGTGQADTGQAGTGAGDRVHRDGPPEAGTVGSP
jgi:hypothetical protein